MITAPQHAVVDSVYDAVRAAVLQLLRAGGIRSDSSAGPVYFVPLAGDPRAEFGPHAFPASVLDGAPPAFRS
ncbi:hypothetical protein AB0A71_34495 [Kitasatospora aureofaciens]|uniref:hypothetical protein n=1 Tax=Kitasatospora aureofaciens TaxID=1894 RepID=UPI0033D67574